MKKPTTQLQAVLYMLLHDTMTPLKFVKQGMTSYSQRIGDLRKLGLEVRCKEIKFKNKFGHPSKYAEWTINKREGGNIYKALQEKIKSLKNDKVKFRRSS